MVCDIHWFYLVLITTLWQFVGEQLTLPIYDIALDSSGTIFCVHTGGVSSYNGEEWASITIGDYNCVAIDDNDVIWLGSREDLGLNYIMRIDSKGKTIICQDSAYIKYVPINDIAIDSDRGKIWYVSSNGILCL